MALWHERDLTHSSVERVIIPDSCIVLHYMLDKFTDIIKGLIVYEDNMYRNIEITRGLIFSQELMLALVGKGMLREDAYRIVQKHAMESWAKGLNFKKLVLQDQEINGRLTPEELEKVFSYDIYREKVDYIFRRCGLE